MKAYWWGFAIIQISLVLVLFYLALTAQKVVVNEPVLDSNTGQYKPHYVEHYKLVVDRLIMIIIIMTTILLFLPAIYIEDYLLERHQ